MLVLMKIAYCNIHTINTAKAPGPQKFCSWAICGPRAFIWTTLMWRFSLAIHIRIQHHFSSFFWVLAGGNATVASGPLSATHPLAQSFIAVVLSLFSQWSQIQTYDFVREPYPRNTQVSWHICFKAERSLLHKILDVLLKDCWGPHKLWLRGACGSQNSGWEPLLKRSLHKNSLNKLFAQFRHTVHTHSLTLTFDFSNLWKKCYRFTHAFFTQYKTTWLSAIISHRLAAVHDKMSAFSSRVARSKWTKNAKSLVKNVKSLQKMPNSLNVVGFDINKWVIWQKHSCAREQGADYTI